MLPLLQKRETGSAGDAVRACVAIGEGLFASTCVFNYKAKKWDYNRRELYFALSADEVKKRG